MQEGGFLSHTLMHSCYQINNKRDFDLYYEDFLPRVLKKYHSWLSPILPYVVFGHCIRNFDIFHIPFSGGVLSSTPLKRYEAFLMKLGRCKIICIPYGGDAYVCDEIRDISLKHALLSSYPLLGKETASIKKDILYWSKHADSIILGLMVDSFPRWDVICGNFVSIDAGAWKNPRCYSFADGLNGPVRISHTPNHRGCKGTEYLIEAVDKLKREGLQVELLLIEGKKNEEIKQLLQYQSDIHCDQLIIPGYGLSAIEGMAAGLPVMANLESEDYLQAFRRFSFLKHCPIFSASPETVYHKLKFLVTEPSHRAHLGKEGERYVKQFHSYQMAQYLFGSIYKKIWNGEEIDLMNLFHPLKSTYYSSYPGLDIRAIPCNSVDIRNLISYDLA